jgi:hypothetical protein
LQMMGSATFLFGGLERSSASTSSSDMFVADGPLVAGVHMKG